MNSRARVTASQSRKGFTLIELLVTIVIIGILASIAISQMGGVKNAAIEASAIVDLKNLAVGQERAYMVNGQYLSTGTRTTSAAGVVTGTMGAPLNTFAPSKGNSVTINNGDGQTWSATVTNVATGEDASCTISAGVGLPGIPVCTGFDAASPGGDNEEE